MKNILCVLIIVLVSFTTKSQTLVDTAQQLKNVVLEEFTGIHCGYCPQGHAVAQALQTGNPGKVVLINIHGGTYATPSTGEPDYRTSFDSALAAQTALTGYPSGTVNRHVFSGLGMTTGGTAMGRSNWVTAANQILVQNAIVNIGVSSQFNSVTRNLTVIVELFYTGSSSTSANYLNVALIQDSIIGVQQNGSTLVTNYVHNHMLRYLITGQWGDIINTTTQGTFVTRTYNYIVPASYTSIPCDISKCDIAVFVTQSTQEVLNGVAVDADGGTNMFIGDIDAPIVDIVDAVSAPTHTFTTTAYSSLSGTESFEFVLTNDAPTGWSSSFTIDGNYFIDTGVVSITNGIPANIYIDVIPDGTPYVASYTLTMKSVTNPNAPVKYINTYVISNVTDLVVNGSGSPSWTSGTGTVDFETDYLNGLAYAGNTHYASTSATIMEKGITENAFTGVKNIYANIAWSFPALQDNEAVALQTFLNGGGNLFIAGQDMGWDIMSGATGSNGTTTTQGFYTNYLHATWIDDGTAANTPLNASTTDFVFHTVASSAIVYGIYGSGNMYPDQISPATGSLPIFYYGTGTTKCAGIRYFGGNYKIVYLGVGIEMLSSATTKSQIIKQSHDWFYGLFTNTEDFKNEALINVYPNPSSDNIYIDTKSENFEVELFNLSGCLIYKTNSQKVIDISNIPNGLYMLTVKDGNDKHRQKISVVK